MISVHYRSISSLIVFILLSFVIIINGCYQEETEKEPIVKNNKAAELLRQQFAGKIEKAGKQKLSEYGFFKGNISEMSPADNVIPYDLNTPLFSDYALKARFIKVPANEKIDYQESDVLKMPVGTFLIITKPYS